MKLSKLIDFLQWCDGGKRTDLKQELNTYSASRHLLESTLRFVGFYSIFYKIRKRVIEIPNVELRDHCAVRDL
jgi:hypothetical protein